MDDLMPAAVADHSERFVCGDADAVLLRNLAAVWLTQPGVAPAIERADDFASHITVSAARDGAQTATAKSDAGTALQLHSRYAPLDEARKLVAAVVSDKIGVYFVLGFGLGHHVKELYDRTGDTVRIFCFEPDPRVLRAAIEHVDLSDALGSGRIRLINTLDRAELTKHFTAESAAIAAGHAIVEHRPSLQRSPAYFDEVRDALRDGVAHCRTQISTIVNASKLTAENLARNLPLYLTTPGLERLRGAFAGKPAIVVSAGPSLRKNKHLLAQAKDNAVLVSVQTTLQILLEMGIEPHFVTSLDYHEICRKFYERVPANCRTELVAEPKATDRIFEAFGGPVTLLGNDFADSLVRELKLKRPKLRAGATVAHLAFYLAEFMGCDPILFVGQDLGFSDGLCYTPGTAYDDVWRPELGRFCTVEQKQWEQIVRDRPILRRVNDYKGRPMYSEERLWSYLQQFERDFAASPARIVDCTEGGVAKRGVQSMSLADALDKFCAKPLGASVPPYNSCDASRVPEALAALRTRVAEAEEIASIARQTLPLVEEVRDHIDDQRRVNAAIAKIDPLRARMDQLGKTYELALVLSQQSEFQRFQNDLSIGASKLDGSSLQRRQAERDADNVRAIISAVESLKELLVNTIDRLESFNGRAA
jgi:hypothetical protein